MLKFYKEPNGDYMVVDHARDAICPDGTLSARACAIEGSRLSVQGTSASREYIAKCIRVRRAEVPAEWLAMLV